MKDLDKGLILLHVLVTYRHLPFSGHPAFRQEDKMSLHPALRRVLLPVRAPSAVNSESATLAASSSSPRKPNTMTRSPFVATKLADGRWQKPRYSARMFKQLFVATNYGRDVPQGYVFPAGPNGRAEKLLAREKKREEEIDGEFRLLELAQQHFPPSRASIQAISRAGSGNQDRKAYLEKQGPYSGRRLGDDGSKAFKGHSNERKRPQRKADVEARLAKMNMQYDAYAKVSTLFDERCTIPF